MSIKFVDLNNLDPEDTKYGIVITEEQQKEQDAKDKVKAMQKQLSTIFGGLVPGANDKEEEEEEEEIQEKEETDGFHMTLEEAKENDRPKKEIYPKF